LVTGRRLDDLFEVCGCLDSFDCVIAENGGLLYEPATRETTLLARPASEELVFALRSLGVPLDMGQTIIATCVPYQTVAFDLIEELNLDLQVIFNRESVMILPTGVNKASGLCHALLKFGIFSRQIVGVGDAENDLAFLRISGLAVAVANAIDSVKNEAAYVTKGAAGDGIIELIDELIAADLEDLALEPGASEPRA
jgi:hydroxymethylpyrimidine pyrophosphatase-like HAD family hydrolase